MNQPAPTHEKPRDWWWLYALIAAASASLQCVLVRFWPNEPLIWLVTVFAVTFGAVMYFHPMGRLRRWAGALFGFGLGCASVPSLIARLKWDETRNGEFLIDNSPFLAIACLAIGFLLACLDATIRAESEGKSSSRLGAVLIALACVAGYITTGSRSEAEPAIANTSGTQSVAKGATVADSPGAIVGSTVQGAVEINVGASDETVQKILDANSRAIDSKDQQLAERDSEIEALRSALARAERQANEGDAQAVEALKQARETGDIAELQRLLLDRAAVLDAQVAPQLAELTEVRHEAAAIAYLRGDIATAESSLQALIDFDPNDIAAINSLSLVHKLRGNLHAAEQGFRRMLELAEDNPAHQAVAYGNLGLIYQTRGDLPGAEEMLRKSLAIEEELGSKEGMASQYGNLGAIYQTRSDLPGAEEMFRKSLALNEELGSKSGMASNYANIGVIYSTRGDLPGAEEMLRKSLALNEELGSKAGMASDYGNLGVIYQTRGDLPGAEEMLRKSLTLSEELGRKAGMAIQYGNLGMIYETRGDLPGAEEMLRKSLALNEELGSKSGMASNYANIGVIYRRRGDLEGAEEMLRKALAINEELGRKEGVANAYGNLGWIYKMRGDLAQARDYWLRSRDLFAEIGMPHMVEQLQGWIDELPPESDRGE
ncbi:photosystem I assembly protein Ycf3 [Pseudobythopirellula maris]|uniref:Photosystem I assembly protein Ycf3 n=1 Tax=Pseudobythopirellula maris TaxID=2527991 RepID=A0A5C5ZPH7_9BACT|nr:photosystem I assembly protein Ycf3 [Pseudobythopirellula maris]